MPVYLRITADGNAKEWCTSRKCDPKIWNQAAGIALGKKEEIKELNSHLEILKLKVYEIRRNLIESNKSVSAEVLKNVLTGKNEKPRMLLEIYQNHNDQMAALVGSEYAPGTMQRYKTSLDHTRSFLQWKYQLSDIDIRHMDFDFISDYEFWLKSIRKCSHNTAMKYLGNFKKIVIKCIRSGWLTKDPFDNFKMTKREVERTALFKEELEVIGNKIFSTDRLTQVRDIFLFCCFTGLAYADVKKLKRSEIALGIDGGKWIFTNRQKTETSSRIPLLPTTLEIIEKYKDHPQCIHQDKVLPVLTNQKMNAYLKEIADVCGIKKTFTFHIARHTFATTVTLSNGVPIETVSKMLGHKNLKTTQHYAKILDRKVSDDMEILREKLKAV